MTPLYSMCPAVLLAALNMLSCPVPHSAHGSSALVSLRHTTIASAPKPSQRQPLYMPPRRWDLGEVLKLFLSSPTLSMENNSHSAFQKESHSKQSREGLSTWCVSLIGRMLPREDWRSPLRR